MIKTLKRKFIVAAMIAVTVLLAALLGALNAVNAWSTSQESARLLENLVQMEISGPPGIPEGEEPPSVPEGEKPPDRPEDEGRRDDDRDNDRNDWGGWDQGRPGGFMTNPLTEDDRPVS